ncbi:ATP-dependent DNA helicase RecG [Lysinibacillus sphaericus]|uniref:ATP-dependent DNA helicase RecG n=1 Tax=Lysinibacillus sphaericus TaxID=1421 RepID=A0A2S0K3Y7_LYSSH|nr:ATP-dependent DNA helicase RecG [Lysinibacillus sphaericus]AVK98048.1 DNA helicase RecG [Lysinibacillus sphaericus]MCS1380803.1 ATP-dependent DNA helicase RecG [Lysinibacillus sphaericus]MED4543550.1 ATP-dependent DNA helicase RecG [Lysinibacillus sphaericus]TKI19043.1 ATP-dependent DNA helicase RecG [Lysinibacillus sphaericus]UDK95778.1 ATP-dependent DNA helicase RecG [Lysinibacillus sphaericus]
MTELSSPVSELKGVGKETAAHLETLGIETVNDILWTFPHRHEDFRLKDLAQTPHNERVTVECKVEREPTVLFLGRNKSRLQVTVLAGRHLVKVVFFNQNYLKQKLIPGTIVTVTGKWDRGRQVINGTTVTFGPKIDQVDFEPVYSLRGLIPQKRFRKYMRQVLDDFGAVLPDAIPQHLQDAYKLVSIRDGLEGIHFPQNAEHAKQARRRFAYEELLNFQLRIQALRKIRKDTEHGTIIQFDLQKLRAFIASLPYELTGAQKRVVNEICKDLKAPHRMNRLLQGDVGSGKTVVAAICLYAAVTAGFQGALMAPTEILAEQHAENLVAWFEPFGVRVALLSGSTKTKERRLLLAALADGEIDIVIGTHALIQPDVLFKRLGFVITDEQHRFGVEQRRILRDKGENPDVLFMTATPIPRTLAITAFGEMDVSLIDEMPAGRKEIETHWMKKEQLGSVLAKLELELTAGRQAYAICPLIEESDKLDVQNAVEIYEQLASYFTGRFKVGLMHGRLPADEKDAIMRGFSEGDIHVLVSTTVVEVGVNVPNATFMVVYDAERFGLAQLHQLRGRVGRGEHQSYCILIADPKSDEGKERMQSMTETNDGFRLAEKDLELRGPGDFFGRKQSGLPDFKVADLVHDYRTLETARKDATEMIDTDAFWHDEMYRYLREMLQQSGVLQGERFD